MVQKNRLFLAGLLILRYQDCLVFQHLLVALMVLLVPKDLLVQVNQLVQQVLEHQLNLEFLEFLVILEYLDFLQCPYLLLVLLIQVVLHFLGYLDCQESQYHL